MSVGRLGAGAYQVEKLDGDNFSSWKLQMKSILVTNDLFDYVDGSKLKPEGEGSTDEQRAAWKAVDDKALAWIILGIKPSQLLHVKNCKTSREAWLKVHEVFQPRGPARKICLFKQLLKLRKQEGESMQSHLNQFFEIVDKLTEIEHPVPEEFLSIILLCSLSDEYENFCIAIESRDTLPDLEALKVKILEEEARRKERVDSNNETTNKAPGAFSTKSKFKASTSTQKPVEKPKFKFKCYACGKKGHKASECPRKKAEKGQLLIAMEGMLSSTSTELLTSNDWCIDSGATSHMCCNKQMFLNLEKAPIDAVQLADKSKIKIGGIGTVMINTQVKGETFPVKLQNVLFVPKLQGNLLSVAKAVMHDCKVEFHEETACITNKNNKVFIEANKKNDLFIIKQTNEPKLMMAGNENNSDTMLWHRRFGHLNNRDLQSLQNNNMVLGIKGVKGDILNCEVCLQGKITKLPFPQKSDTKSENILDLVHTDVCGPMRVKSLGGAKYFVTFIDDKSRATMVYFIREKSEVFKVFKQYKELVETQTGRKIKCLRSDNAQEYKSKEFTEYLESCGCKRQFTVAYTPEQNGVAERANRTLVEMARCMLIESGMPPSLWAEAVATAVYIRNRCPSSALEGTTPYEEWYNRKPVVKHFRVFGCKVFALIKGPKQGKFDPKGKEYTLVGYSSEQKGYRLYDKDKKNITISRDVRFIETIAETIEPNCELQLNFPDYHEMHKELNLNESQRDDEEDSEESDFCESDEKHAKPTDPLVSKRGRGRPSIIRTGKRGRPRKVYNTVQFASDNPSSDVDPETVEKAMADKYADKWREAMQAEFDSLIANDTWELVDRPKDRKPLGCKWVFHVKRNADGSVERYKARLVAKGYSQKYGLDYSETFAPVMRYSSMRTVLAIAAESEMHVHQLDVKNAFLHGEVQDEIYMEQPEMFTREGQEDKVYRLKRAIYGLRQAGREWYNKVDQCLRELNFKRSEVDTCIYTSEEHGGIIVAIYVDDILVASKSLKAIEEFKRNFGKLFCVKDQGPLHYCLGIEVLREGETGSIGLFHRRYIQDLLVKYGMENCKATSTPMEPCHISTCDNAKQTEDINFPYKELVGSLIHLAVTTRPDIAYPVSVLSQHCNKPTQEHWKAAKRVLRYLSGSKDQGIVYHKTDRPLVGYTDADWGSDVTDRKSYTGFSFLLAGGAIAWESKKQQVVALSSTEAEYIALSQASKEAVYLKQLVSDLMMHGAVCDRTIIYCDNQSAQCLVKNPVYHARTKHIDIKFHYVRDVYNKHVIDIQYVRTDDMLADCLTKSLPKLKYDKCIKGLGMQNITERLH